MSDNNNDILHVEGNVLRLGQKLLRAAHVLLQSLERGIWQARQIAGLIARRIISYMKVGEPVEQNSVCGFIKFGSRVDVLIPKDSELLVEIGDPVVGSQTPIARLHKI